jgi:hypothetical protein
MKSIKISNQTYMHVYLHEVNFSLEEAFSQADDTSVLPLYYEESAKLLIDSMEDHWCIALLEAIKKECENRIYEHWEEFSPKKNNKLE